MECPECPKKTQGGSFVAKVRMTESPMSYRCPVCSHKIRKAAKTITLSETDVARVLQAVLNTERKTVLGRSVNCLESGAWTLTPEGWPVPSRRLMEEIKKLL